MSEETVEMVTWMSAEHGTSQLPAGEKPDWYVEPKPKGAPAESANKSEWASHAESLGIEPGKLTKEELIAAVREQEK